MRDRFSVAIMLACAVVLVAQPNPQVCRTALAFGVLCCVLRLLVRRR